MYVKFLRVAKVSPDGFSRRIYEKGAEADLPEVLARGLVASGTVEIAEKPVEAAPLTDPGNAERKEELSGMVVAELRNVFVDVFTDVEDAPDYKGLSKAELIAAILDQEAKDKPEE